MSEEILYLTSDVELGLYTPPKTKAEKHKQAPSGFREESINGVWESSPAKTDKKRGFHESF